MSISNTITKITSQKRQQLKSLQDEFMTFSWGGIDAFEEFGAFIINDKKGSLKFYNGAGFSNEYAKTQFSETGGFLQGVNFNQQTIDFTIGVYWFSIEEYRRLLKWLSPLKVDYLQFGFSPKYRYDVKLSKRSDSTRWIVGRENGEPRYYTELQLSFEVQGAPCAKGMYSYEFSGNSNQNANKDKYWSFDIVQKEAIGSCYLYTGNKVNSEFIPSDLETPIQVRFGLDLTLEYIEANYFLRGDSVVIVAEYENDEVKIDSNAEFKDSSSLKLTAQINNNISKYEIELSALYMDEEIKLCNMSLQHLTTFIEKGFTLWFTYYSETGLVFLQKGSSNQGNLLTLQTYTDDGEFLVESLQSHKFMLPGELDYPGFYDNPSNLSFKLKFKKKIRNAENTDWIDDEINKANYEQPISIEVYPRTNII